MSKTKRTIALSVLVGGLLVSACAGAAFRQASSWPGVASDGTTVFVAMNQFVYAVDLGSGVGRWQYPAEPERNRTFYAPPAITEDGTVIVADFNNQLTALRPENGVEVWGPVSLSDDRNDRVIGAPTLAGDLVLVPSTDGRLYARRISDGAAEWSFPPASSEPLDEAIWSAPLVAGERVYLAAMDHRVYALELATGRELWASAPDLGGALADTPVLADSRLLVGSFASQLVALDPDSGRVIWEYDAQDWVWGAPAVDTEAAYFGDLSGELYAVSLDSGAELWTFSVGDRIAASPAINGDTIYVVSEGGMLTVREARTNNPSWQATIDGQLLTDPLLVDGTVLVASNEGEPLIVAYDAESGAQHWSFTP